MTFTVAIVGRPNVGKSTLFNRMVGKKLALVHDTPGLTRDWRAAPAALMDLEFQAIDTAGLEESFDASIESRMRQQTERAIAQADMVFFVIDARAGLTPMDRFFADWLRKQKVKTVLLANKCESKAGLDRIYEAYELGFGEPIAVSAEHGHGMSDLVELLRPYLAVEEEDETEDENDSDAWMKKYGEGDDVGFGDEEESIEEQEKPIKIAIVGRPNVGKSTFLNALVGEERSMTGPEAGITRDAVHVDWEFKGRKIRLVDTAGMRRRAKVVDAIERMSVDDSLRAVRLAQVVVLMIDGEEPFAHQDLTIASHVIDEGRALVIAINKWDKVKDKEEVLDDLRYQLTTSLAQVRDVPMVTISALNELRLDTLMSEVLTVYNLWNSRVATGRMNRWLQAMESKNPPPLVRGRPNRLRYITQIKARPPTFALWVGRAKEYPETHKRYLINALRRDFKLPATPIRLLVKTSKNPYAS